MQGCELRSPIVRTRAFPRVCKATQSSGMSLGGSMAGSVANANGKGGGQGSGYVEAGRHAGTEGNRVDWL